VAALSAVAGCRRDEVTHFRIPKEQAAAGAPGSAPMGPASSADVPPPPAPSERGSLKWTLPKGWTESKVGGMRYATLKPPVEGRIDVSVVVLPGPAGGELANVNRWRGQIGLPAAAEADLASIRRIVRTKAGAVSVYELESEGTVKSHMTGAVLQAADGNTWFVKMVGDAGPVARVRADFVHLLESLRFD
jgi:hypothetical protein